MLCSYVLRRAVPADLLSALSVCDDIRRGRLIAAVWNLLEAEWLYLNAEELKLKVNSDYIYNVVPHLFICAVHNPNDEQAIKDLTAFSHFLSGCTQYSPSGYDILMELVFIIILIITDICIHIALGWNIWDD